MASQLPPEALRRVARQDPASASRRGRLSPGLAALVMAALGLSVAGSIALTATAEGTPSGGPSAVATAATGPQTTGLRPSASPTASDAAPDPALAPFTPAKQQTQRGATRSPELQAALVKERAAQRAEGLAKSAAQASRAAVAASTEAREQNLSKAERARQVAAAQIADENLRKAVAARIAATTARANAEQNEATNTPVPDPAATAVIPTSGAGVAPVAGAVIGSRFGEYGSWARYHTGLDFRAAYGTPIRAVKSGLVLYAGNSGDWAGNHIAVQHADGITTMSSHMSSMAVSAGETVQAGQVIGYVGQTGRAFGAHLHFEVYPVGVKYGDIYRAVDPVPWLRANGVQTH